MNFYLDHKTLNTTLCGSSQAMVYGWNHCNLYKAQVCLKSGFISDPRKLTNSLKQKSKSRLAPIKVFSFTIGYPENEQLERLLTIEGRLFEQVPIKPKKGEKSLTTRAICKAAITNLVLENFKRQFLELPAIPLIFILDIDKNPYPCTAESITSREGKKRVTNSEIRRCYRHHELAENLNIPELTQATKNTFHFVKYTQKKHGRIVLKKVQPPWEADDWLAYWLKRVSSRKSKKQIKKSPYQWRDYFTRSFDLSEEQSQMLKMMKKKAQRLIRHHITHYVASIKGSRKPTFEGLKQYIQTKKEWDPDLVIASQLIKLDQWPAKVWNEKLERLQRKEVSG